MKAYVDDILGPGRIVSLAQTLLKLTAPGIPDIYQGTELWALSLVDPDNRRPVDFGLRRRLLEEAADATPEQALARADEGLPKLWMMQRALRTRPEGCYQPLTVEGAGADHIVAFARGDKLVTVVPRLTQSLRGGWTDTAIVLPKGRWRNVFTEDEHAGREPVANLFARFPVALLERLAIL